MQGILVVSLSFENIGFFCKKLRGEAMKLLRHMRVLVLILMAFSYATGCLGNYTQTDITTLVNTLNTSVIAPLITNAATSSNADKMAALGFAYTGGAGGYAGVVDFHQRCQIIMRDGDLSKVTSDVITSFRNCIYNMYIVYNGNATYPNSLLSVLTGTIAAYKADTSGTDYSQQLIQYGGWLKNLNMHLTGALAPAPWTFSDALGNPVTYTPFADIAVGTPGLRTQFGYYLPRSDLITDPVVANQQYIPAKATKAALRIKGTTNYVQVVEDLTNPGRFYLKGDGISPVGKEAQFMYTYSFDTFGLQSQLTGLFLGAPQIPFSPGNALLTRLSCDQMFSNTSDSIPRFKFNSTLNTPGAVPQIQIPGAATGTMMDNPVFGILRWGSQKGVSPVIKQAISSANTAGFLTLGTDGYIRVYDPATTAASSLNTFNPYSVTAATEFEFVQILPLYDQLQQLRTVTDIGQRIAGYLSILQNTIFSSDQDVVYLINELSNFVVSYRTSLSTWNTFTAAGGLTALTGPQGLVTTIINRYPSPSAAAAPIAALNALLGQQIGLMIGSILVDSKTVILKVSASAASTAMGVTIATDQMLVNNGSYLQLAPFDPINAASYIKIQTASDSTISTASPGYTLSFVSTGTMAGGYLQAGNVTDVPVLQTRKNITRASFGAQQGTDAQKFVISSIADARSGVFKLYNKQTGGYLHIDNNDFYVRSLNPAMSPAAVYTSDASTAQFSIVVVDAFLNQLAQLRSQIDDTVRANGYVALVSQITLPIHTTQLLAEVQAFATAAQQDQARWTAWGTSATTGIKGILSSLMTSLTSYATAPADQAVLGNISTVLASVFVAPTGLPILNFADGAQGILQASSDGGKTWSYLNAQADGSYLLDSNQALPSYDSTYVTAKLDVVNKTLSLTSAFAGGNRLSTSPLVTDVLPGQESAQYRLRFTGTTLDSTTNFVYETADTTANTNYTTNFYLKSGATYIGVDTNALRIDKRPNAGTYVKAEALVFKVVPISSLQRTLNDTRKKTDVNQQIADFTADIGLVKTVGDLRVYMYALKDFVDVQRSNPANFKAMRPGFLTLLNTLDNTTSFAAAYNAVNGGFVSALVDVNNSLLLDPTTQKPLSSPPTPAALRGYLSLQLVAGSGILSFADKVTALTQDFNQRNIYPTYVQALGQAVDSRFDGSDADIAALLTLLNNAQYNQQVLAQDSGAAKIRGFITTLQTKPTFAQRLANLNASITNILNTPQPAGSDTSAAGLARWKQSLISFDAPTTALMITKCTALVGALSTATPTDYATASQALKSLASTNITDTSAAATIMGLASQIDNYQGALSITNLVDGTTLILQASSDGGNTWSYLNALPDGSYVADMSPALPTYDTTFVIATVNVQSKKLSLSIPSTTGGQKYLKIPAAGATGVLAGAASGQLRLRFTGTNIDDTTSFVYEPVQASATTSTGPTQFVLKLSNPALATVSVTSGNVYIAADSNGALRIDQLPTQAVYSTATQALIFRVYPITALNKALNIIHKKTDLSQQMTDYTNILGQVLTVQDLQTLMFSLTDLVTTNATNIGGLTRIKTSFIALLNTIANTPSFSSTITAENSTFTTAYTVDSVTGRLFIPSTQKLLVSPLTPSALQSYLNTVVSGGLGTQFTLLAFADKVTSLQQDFNQRAIDDKYLDRVRTTVANYLDGSAADITALQSLLGQIQFNTLVQGQDSSRPVDATGKKVPSIADMIATLNTTPTFRQRYIDLQKTITKISDQAQTPTGFDSAATGLLVLKITALVGALDASSGPDLADAAKTLRALANTNITDSTAAQTILGFATQISSYQPSTVAVLSMTQQIKNASTALATLSDNTKDAYRVTINQMYANRIECSQADLAAFKDLLNRIMWNNVYVTPDSTGNRIPDGAKFNPTPAPGMYAADSFVTYYNNINNPFSFTDWQTNIQNMLAAPQLSTTDQARLLYKLQQWMTTLSDSTITATTLSNTVNLLQQASYNQMTAYATQINGFITQVNNEITRRSGNIVTYGAQVAALKLLIPVSQTDSSAVKTFITKLTGLVNTRVQGMDSEVANLQSWLATPAVQNDKALFYANQISAINQLAANLSISIPYADYVNDLTSFVQQQPSTGFVGATAADARARLLDKARRITAQRARATTAQDTYDLSKIAQLFAFIVNNYFPLPIPGDTTSLDADSQSLISTLNGYQQQLAQGAPVGNTVRFVDQLTNLKQLFKQLDTTATIDSFVKAAQDLVNNRVDATQELLKSTAIDTTNNLPVGLQPFLQSDMVKTQGKLIFNDSARASIDQIATSIDVIIPYVQYYSNIRTLLQNYPSFYDPSIAKEFLAKAIYLVNQRAQAQSEGFKFDYITQILQFAITARLGESNVSNVAVIKTNDSDALKTAKQLLNCWTSGQPFVPSSTISYQQAFVFPTATLATTTSTTLDLFSTRCTNLIATVNAITSSDLANSAMLTLTQLVNDRFQGTDGDLTALATYIDKTMRFQQYIYLQTANKTKIDAFVQILNAPIAFADLANYFHNFVTTQPAFTKTHKQVFLMMLGRIIATRGQAAAANVDLTALASDIQFARINRFTIEESVNQIINPTTPPIADTAAIDNYIVMLATPVSQAELFAQDLASQQSFIAGHAAANDFQTITDAAKNAWGPNLFRMAQYAITNYSSLSPAQSAAVMTLLQAATANVFKGMTDTVSQQALQSQTAAMFTQFQTLVSATPGIPY